MKEETLKKVVDWWAGKLISSRNSGLSPKERNEPTSLAYGLFEVLKDSLKPTVPKEQVEAFKTALHEKITEKSRITEYIVLRVDYHPDGILRQALEVAGVEPDHALPIKTTMWIDGDRIEFSYGYGAPVETL